MSHSRLHQFLIASSAIAVDKENDDSGPKDSVAQTGSWDPTGALTGRANTAGFASLSDAATIPDEFAAIYALRAGCAVSVYGDMYGVTGGEQAVLVKTPTIPFALFHYEQQDVSSTPRSTSPANLPGFPGLNPGESARFHISAAQIIDAFWTWTNDGAQSGDQLGGLKGVAGSQFSVATVGDGTADSPDGHSFVIDDSVDAVTITMASGNVVQINDATNQLTATIGSATLTMDGDSGEIWLNGESLSSGDAIVRQSDLQAAITALAMRCASGSGVTAPTCTGSAVSFTA